MSYQEIAQRLLIGAYDLHIHPSPSPFDRIMDDIQLLRMAGNAGMAGVILKSHYEPTAARAAMANRYAASCACAYGAIVLNWPVGGLNPYAVHNALKRGAKMVFLPTRDAANSLESGNMPGDFFDRPGIKILDERGKLKPEIYDIIDIIRDHNAVLATGHISPQESIEVCKECISQKARIVLTHPEFSRTKIDAKTQKELADIGVMIEKCWYNIAEHECSAAEMAANICRVGAEHCFLSTDRGQSGKEFPVEAMKRFILKLLENGISESDIFTMTHTVPKIIVGDTAAQYYTDLGEKIS